jgi:DNA-binding NarL/FixJ family response regulator
MEDALNRIAESQPDIAIVDIGLPGMSRIEGIGTLEADSSRAVGPHVNGLRR